MLDLNKIGKEVDQLISKITKEDYERWLILDKLREEQAFARGGHPLKFSNSCQIYTSISMNFKTALEAVSFFDRLFNFNMFVSWN